jgi:uncharacterized membrane protein YeiH
VVAAFAEILYDLTVTFKEYATGTLLVLDLIGTFVFALSGAVVGSIRRHRLQSEIGVTWPPRCLGVC